MDDVLDQFNVWNRELDFGVDRLFAYQQIANLIGRKEIQVITGIRRSGKTTLMRQCMRFLVDSGIAKRQLLFIPCDNPLLGLETIHHIHQLIDHYRKQVPGKIYIFLDEIQAVPGFEKYLKAVYDADTPIKFIISGSTASFFASDVASLLTGRHFYHKMGTMQYKEYLRLKKDGSFKDYIEWGGFPEIIKARTTSEKKALLESYLNTIIERDIIKKNDIRNRKKLSKFLESILLQTGGKININRLSRQFELNKRSITHYLSIAQDAFLLQEVPFFSHSKRKNKHMLPKIYPADIGFTRMLSERFEQGRSAEWAVAHFLNNPTYWSDANHEVDFITKEEAIQVTLAEKIPEREYAALLAFTKKHQHIPRLLGPRSTENTIAIEEFINQ